jgi:hypothetical protein
MLYIFEVKSRGTPTDREMKRGEWNSRLICWRCCCLVCAARAPRAMKSFDRRSNVSKGCYCGTQSSERNMRASFNYLYIYVRLRLLEGKYQQSSYASLKLADMNIKNDMRLREQPWSVRNNNKPRGFDHFLHFSKKKDSNLFTKTATVIAQI